MVNGYALYLFKDSISRLYKRMNENSELMLTVSQKLETPKLKIENTPSKNSTDSKGPLNWKEDSSEKDVNLEDISNFINMRKDLLDNDFSFKLTRTENPSKSEYSGKILEINLNELQNDFNKPSKKKGALKENLDNVFQEVVGNTLLKKENQSFTDTFLRTEDYQLSLTGHKREDPKKVI
jgi:hypothetical protein